MSVLELRGVSYAYPDGTQAVANISVAFDSGESVAIVGQNGAGKTTTAKLMNGLLRPDKGEVLIHGEQTASISTARMSQQVGYVFQNPDDQIFQDTIEKEIAFGPKKEKYDDATLKLQVQRAAEICGLTDVLQEQPYNLPYSKRKFITIAAVIAMNPPVIILDEPTAGQDRESTDMLGHIIRTLTDQGKTVITITHDMEFVLSGFHRVLVFADKQLQADGSPRDIFWNEPLLKLSHLQQPYICQLASALGISGVMTMDELERKIPA